MADFRTRLGVGPEPPVETLEVTEGLEGDGWAEQEYVDAELGDRRLSHRLVDSARIQARAPGRAFCGAARGDWPRVKGYYRMIDQPQKSAVTMEAILAPHRRRTLARMRAQPTVLCIQDGTDLNYSSLARCEGLGVIGTNQTGANSRGAPAFDLGGDDRGCAAGGTKRPVLGAGAKTERPHASRLYPAH